MAEGTLIEPQERPANVPAEAEWLGGIGAGAYFHIELVDNKYLVSRWDLNGKQDCQREMRIESSSNSAVTFDIQQAYHFEYPSHCAEVNILQGEVSFKFLI